MINASCQHPVIEPLELAFMLCTSPASLISCWLRCAASITFDVCVWTTIASNSTWLAQLVGYVGAGSYGNGRRCPCHLTLLFRFWYVLELALNLSWIGNDNRFVPLLAVGCPDRSLHPGPHHMLIVMIGLWGISGRA